MNAKHRIRFEHLVKLNGGRHENITLQRCWTKHGANSFRIEIVWEPSHEVASTLDRESLSKLCRVMEAIYGYAAIEAGHSLMNMANFDRWGSCGNMMYSNERRQQLSAKLRMVRSDKAANAAILAVTHGPEAIAKRSAVMLEHWSNGKTRERVEAYWANPENKNAHRAKMDSVRKTEAYISAQSAGMLRVFRSVRCVDTGEIFESVNSAARAKSIEGTHITRSIKRNIKAGGYRWEYV